MKDCPFCDISSESVFAENDRFIAILDRFPISPGHALLIPRRHCASFFELDSRERADLLALLDVVKDRLDAEHHPDAYNIGINDGGEAGQTIFHLHVHLIPRYRGDRPDPRGGVRWILPEKAVYWEDES